jgi:hypothetical protein
VAQNQGTVAVNNKSMHAHQVDAKELSNQTAATYILIFLSMHIKQNRTKHAHQVIAK